LDVEGGSRRRFKKSNTGLGCSAARVPAHITTSRPNVPQLEAFIFPDLKEGIDDSTIQDKARDRCFILLIPSRGKKPSRKAVHK
jgi:hypothetical protein